jgi:glycosyltransferase involved in cell wall biosynthesis
MLDGSLVRRLTWQRTTLVMRARDVDLLFAPGGVSTPLVRPRVVMSQNLLPFDPSERQRYGWSRTRLRLEMLRFGQAQNFGSADGVIFLNEYARAQVTAAMSRPPRRYAIIPHGVAERFRAAPRPPRHRSQLSREAPLRVLYVSSVAPYKHQCSVIEAVVRLRDVVPIELTLIGGNDRTNYSRDVARAIADAAAVGVHVRHLGALPFEALHTSYAAAELFVFASSCENMPNILLEAMSNGLPIACARRGPMPDMLGDAGAYFDPERPAEIAAAVQMLAEDANLRTTYAERAITKSKVFSWERCARETFAFLAEVAREGAG